MGFKHLIAALAALCAIALAPAAAADTLTITVNVNASNLSSQLTGVHVGCQAYFDPQREAQPIAQFPAQSQLIPRAANGTATGTVTVTINNWVPEARYWKCYLAANTSNAFGGFAIPGAPDYNTAAQWRRGQSGTILVQGTIQ